MEQPAGNPPAVVQLDEPSEVKQGEEPPAVKHSEELFVMRPSSTGQLEMPPAVMQLDEPPVFGQLEHPSPGGKLEGPSESSTLPGHCGEEDLRPLDTVHGHSQESSSTESTENKSEELAITQGHSQENNETKSTEKKVEEVAVMQCLSQENGSARSAENKIEEFAVMHRLSAKSTENTLKELVVVCMHDDGTAENKSKELALEHSLVSVPAPPFTDAGLHWETQGKHVDSVITSGDQGGTEERGNGVTLSVSENSTGIGAADVSAVEDAGAQVNSSIGQTNPTTSSQHTSLSISAPFTPQYPLSAPLPKLPSLLSTHDTAASLKFSPASLCSSTAPRPPTPLKLSREFIPSYPHGSILPALPFGSPPPCPSPSESLADSSSSLSLPLISPSRPVPPSPSCPVPPLLPSPSLSEGEPYIPDTVCVQQPISSYIYRPNVVDWSSRRLIGLGRGSPSNNPRAFMLPGYPEIQPYRPEPIYYDPAFCVPSPPFCPGAW